jgi:hypothetical protein
MFEFFEVLEGLPFRWIAWGNEVDDIPPEDGGGLGDKRCRE